MAVIIVTVVVGMCVCMMETMLDTVNHRAGAKEEQPFKESMGNQVKKAGSIGADAQSSDHKAKLGNS